MSLITNEYSDTLWTDVQGVSLHEQRQLQFGKEAPSFGPGTIINSRGISTTFLNLLGVENCVLKIQVFYNLIERNYNSTCFSSESTTLALPQIQYRQANNNWTTVNNRKEKLIIVYKLQCFMNIAMITHTR